jgi:hypothetical protein
MTPVDSPPQINESVDCQTPLPWDPWRQGDQLISTSGVTYTRTEDYGGVTVRKGQEIVTLNCLGESFKTVSAAIGSHPASIPVRLTCQRCDPAAVAAAAAAEAGAAATAAVNVP